MQDQLSHAHSLGKLTYTSATRVIATVLPTLDALPALPTAVAGEGQGKLTYFHTLRANSLILPRLGGEAICPIHTSLWEEENLLELTTPGPALL